MAKKNKEKHINKAQNFLRRGNIDKAIKEYLAAFEEDKKDVRLLMKLGDVFVRKKDNKSAVDYYLQAAKFLTKDGFYSRAAAVYRQILQLDDTRIEILEDLADLYNKLGLNNEAMAQYQKIATSYEREGKLTDALEILQRMLGLDPRNIVLCTKLAELHYKLGQKDEGYASFRQALDQLQEEGRYEQYVKLLEKLAKADPDNNENLKELGEIYVEHERWDRAYAVLARLIENNPDDAESLEMLGDVAVKIGRTDHAVKFYKKLAGYYKQKGLRQRAKQALRKVLDVKPDDPDALAVVGASGPILKDEEVEEIETIIEDDEPVEVLEEAEPEEIVSEDNDVIEVEEEVEEEGDEELSEDQISEHLTEAEVYLKYGLRDKAFDHLKAILQSSPNNLQAHLKIKDIHLEAGKTDQAVKELEFVTKHALKDGEHEIAEEAVQEWLRIEPDSASARKLEQEVAKAQPEADTEQEPLVEEPEVYEEEVVAAQVEEPEEEFEEPELAEEEFEEAEELEEDPVELAEDEGAVEFEEEDEIEEVEELDEDEDDLEEVEEVEEELEEPEEIEDLDEDDQIDLSETASEEEFIEEVPDEPEVLEEEFEEEVEEVEEVAASADEIESPPETGGDFTEELEEADFYMQQGLFDEAKKIYLVVLSKDPTNSIAIDKMAEIDDSGPEEVVISDTEQSTSFDESEDETPQVIAPVPPKADIPKPPPPPEPPKPPAPPVPETLTEEKEEPPQKKAKSAHPAPPPPPPVPVPPPMAPDEQTDTFDLKSELEKESEEGDWQVKSEEKDLFGGGEDSGLFDLAAELEAEDDIFSAAGVMGIGTDSQEINVDETIAAFKSGVNEQLTDSDLTTRFDLGIAYKEMGLVNDAIQEFTLVSKSPEWFGECMNMISMIHMENGETKAALETCKKALSSSDLKDKYKGPIFFEMGKILKEINENGKARWALEQSKIFTPDINERDEMLGSLQGVTPEPMEFGENTGPSDTGISVDDELEAAFSPEEPPVETGPPPSKEQTSRERAALENPDTEENKKKDAETKNKKRKKISYV